MQKAEEEKVTEAVRDEGIVLSNGVDLCDCLELKVCSFLSLSLYFINLTFIYISPQCPGCHFDCPACGSGKCGHECRKTRTWDYDSVEVEGQQHRRENPLKGRN